MSQFPRRVLSDVYVAWDPHANGAARSTFTRRGTVVDIVPGSALEQAYGKAAAFPAAGFAGLLALQSGPPALSGVIPLSQRGDGPGVDHVAVSN
jgi:hypothetical protein